MLKLLICIEMTWWQQSNSLVALPGTGAVPNRRNAQHVTTHHSGCPRIASAPVTTSSCSDVMAY
jgi:hypothetical protein